MQIYKITNGSTVADVYGAGTFSNCNYNSTTCTPDNSGTLANTGMAVAGFVTFACIIALVAIAVRIWRRPAKKPVPETIAVEADNEGGDEAADQSDKRA